MRNPTNVASSDARTQARKALLLVVPDRIELPAFCDGEDRGAGCVELGLQRDAAVVVQKMERGRSARARPIPEMGWHGVVERTAQSSVDSVLDDMSAPRPLVRFVSASVGHRAVASTGSDLVKVSETAEIKRATVPTDQGIIGWLARVVLSILKCMPVELNIATGGAPIVESATCAARLDGV